MKHKQVSYVICQKLSSEMRPPVVLMLSSWFQFMCFDCAVFLPIFLALFFKRYVVINWHRMLSWKKKKKKCSPKERKMLKDLKRSNSVSRGDSACRVIFYKSGQSLFGIYRNIQLLWMNKTVKHCGKHVCNNYRNKTTRNQFHVKWRASV